MASLLTLYGVLALSAVSDQSPTYDEPLHLTAGYSYWRYNDYRLQPENGNLPQRWATFPLRWQRPALAEGAPAAWWTTTDFPALKDHFLYDAGNDPDRMFAAARRAALFWGLALGLLVFAWSRRLWGDAAACLSLTLYALSPTMLAHGPLVTSDVCAAFFLVAAAGAYWRHLERGGLATLALSAAVTGLAVVAKFSFVVLPFVFGAMALWRVLERAPLVFTRGTARHEASTRGRKIAWLAASAAAHLGVAWVIVWTFYGWRYAAGGPELPAMVQFYRLWDHVLPADGALRGAILLARDWRILPEAFLHGFTFVLAAAQARPAFLNGEWGNAGWWWFFPYAFLVKTSLAELLAAAGAAVLLALRWTRTRGDVRAAAVVADIRKVLPLVALVAVYGLVSVTSHLNIGHRHLLPLYPALFIAAGALGAVPAVRWRRLMATGLVAVAALESLAVRPHYLAFFNAAAGGPSQGWRHLVDSSLDWGQDLPGLARWLDRHRGPDERVYFTVFGTARASHYGVTGIALPPSFDDAPRRWVELEAGLYAVSATMLQDVYSPWAGPWSAQDEFTYRRLSGTLRARMDSGGLAPVIDHLDPWGENLRTLDRFRFARLVNYLRLREPTAVVGYSIFIHRLGPDEIHAAVNGSTEEYLALLDRTGRAP